jgi:hypothetical protein
LKAHKYGLILLALSGALLWSCASPSADRAETSTRGYEFTEPDGWWSVEVPKGWAPIRIELDGSVTPLEIEARRSPDPSSSPLRDPLAGEVIYAFRPKESLEKCGTPCPAASVREIAVIARTRADSDLETTARRFSAPLQQDEAVRTSGIECPDALECVALDIATPLSRTWVVLVDAPLQDRTYQIKMSGPIDDWQVLEPAFRAAVSSFRPIRS